MLKKTAVLLLLFAALWFGGTHWLDTVAQTKAEEVAVRLHDEGVDAEWKEVRVNPLSRSATFQEITLSGRTGQKFTAEEIIFSGVDLHNDPPHCATTTVKNIAMPGSRVAEQQDAAMKKLGYATLPARNATLSWRWDKPTKIFTVDRLQIKAAGVGSVNLQATVGNVDLEQKSNRNALMLQLFSMNLSGATFTVVDNGVCERIFKLYAEKRQLTVPEAKAAMIAELQSNAAALGDTAERKSLVTAITSFINDPQQLVVTLAPEKPVPFMQFAVAGRNPVALLQLLRVTAEAKPRP